MNKPTDRPKLRDPRPPSFRTVDEGGHDEFYKLQLACALYQRDEDRKRGRKPRKPPEKGEQPSYPELDTLIRDASHAAADASDLQRAFRIASVADGTRVKIGAKIGCEILAALGRWLDDENGKETP